MAKVQAECGTCDGTGIYSGYTEQKGVGVVCAVCEGTGCEEITYTPFKRLRPRKDIHTVIIRRGTFVLAGSRLVVTSISYKEFVSGKMSIKK